MRLGDRPRDPEAEPARAGAAHAACEDVDRRVDPRPVVGHVDDDHSVVLADADRHARAVAEPVRDEIREHLAQACRVSLDDRPAGNGDVDPVGLELADERGEVDLLASQRAGLVVGEDPLDVPRGRDRQRECARSLCGGQPGGRPRECGQRRDRAPQLVGDELQALGRHARF